MTFLTTIRSKIVFWFVFIVAGLLCAFSTLSYLTLRKNLSEDTDDLLELKAEGTMGYISAYWSEQKRRGIEKGENIDVFLKVHSADFLAIAQHWVNEVPSDQNLEDISVAVFSVHGVPVASSKDAPLRSALPDSLVRAALAEKAHFQTLPTHRVLFVPVVEDRKPICILEVAKPLSVVNAALHKLRAAFFLLIPLSLALASLTGLFLSRLILGPLNRIIGTVRRITAENLRMRVTLPDTRDEIKKLADTFNGMLQELENAFSAQKQIVQDISHELRTPLTIIKGEIEVALKKERTTGEYQQTLRSSLEEINKINRITESLLTLARFDSGQLALDLKPMSLSAAVREAVEDVRLLASHAQVTLAFSSEEGVDVLADGSHLRRALMNIIDNAIKYTPASGTVSVSVSKAAPYALVTIADTGIGIPAEELPHIFNRFYRADASRSSKGFGLGLSLSKAIVEAHHGKIDVQSVVHKGTSFTIHLPLH